VIATLEQALEIVRRYPRHYGRWWEAYLLLCSEERKVKP